MDYDISLWTVCQVSAGISSGVGYEWVLAVPAGCQVFLGLTGSRRGERGSPKLTAGWEDGGGRRTGQADRSQTLSN